MRTHIVIFTLTSLLAYGTMAGTWKVMENDKACILLDMDLNFTVGYATATGTKQSNFELPGNASVDDTGSSCGETEANITLAFFEETYKVTFTFEVLSKTYQLSKVNFNYIEDTTRFPDAKDTGKPKTKSGKLTLFTAPVGYSYRCKTPDMDTTITDLKMTFSNVKLQPFNVTKGNFSDESVCTADLAKSTPMPTTAVTTMMMTNMSMTNMSTEILTTMMDINTTTGAVTTKASPTTMATTTKPPTEGNWTVKDSKGKPCMNMAFKANFSYSYQDAKNKTKTETVMLPFTADPSMSTCGENSSTFALQFEHSNNTWMMEMVFDLLNTKDYTQVDGQYNAFQMTELLVNYTDPLSMNYEVNTTGTYFKTNVNMTYKCDTNDKIEVEMMNVTFADVKFQPFAKGQSYPGELQDCKLDDKSSNVVPIAVGCALAGLVVIVLIAYLIGRKRTKSVGYQTV